MSRNEPRGLEKSYENLLKAGISSDKRTRYETWKEEMSWDDMRTQKMGLHELQRVQTC